MAPSAQPDLKWQFAALGGSGADVCWLDAGAGAASPGTLCTAGADGALTAREAKPRGGDTLFTRDAHVDCVRALAAQVDADTARHLAERAKFAADEAMHLHNAARLRRERDASRGELADLRKRFREEYGRSLFPGQPSGRD